MVYLIYYIIGGVLKLYSIIISNQLLVNMRVFNYSWWYVMMTVLKILYIICNNIILGLALYLIYPKSYILYGKFYY